jgi:hypothetical protein
MPSGAQIERTSFSQPWRFFSPGLFHDSAAQPVYPLLANRVSRERGVFVSEARFFLVVIRIE